MERLYSLKRYSTSLAWLFSVCLSLLFAQVFLGLFNSYSGQIFVTGLLLAVAVDQGIDLVPLWTERFKRLRSFNLLKATTFMVLSAPAFAMILKGGFLFTATTGLLAFAFSELFDYLKPYLGQIKQLQPAPVITKAAVVAEPESLKDPLHERLEAHFRGKTMLVTGAGRHEVTAQLAEFNPSHMILVDDNVEKLDEIFHQIRTRHPNVRVTPHLKIPDHRVQIQHIFEQVKPDVIIHGYFETNGPMLDKNPSYASRINIIDAIDWVDSARKNGVGEFAMLLPNAPESSTAEQCLEVVYRYCQGLQGESANHPTRLLILEEDDAEATLTQYIHALSNQKEVEPMAHFATFQRALHQLEWAVADYNNNEVKSLLGALTPVHDDAVPLAA